MDFWVNEYTGGWPRVVTTQRVGGIVYSSPKLLVYSGRIPHLILHNISSNTPKGGHILSQS